MPRNSQSCQAWHVISLQYLLVPCPPNQPSLGGRILGESRSSLTPEMLEALVCGKDWLFKEKEDNQGQGLCEDQPINPSTVVIPSGTAQHTRSR